jgi:8-oxo-dGTP pyrophosphatase MutT (NUDIX family)
VFHGLKLPVIKLKFELSSGGGMRKIGPWIQKSSKNVYENPWIVVQHDEVIHPDGSEGIYGVVKFKNYAVGIVAVDSESNVTLVGQHRYPFDEYSWEIPEGGSPILEDPLANAKRELEEETGLKANVWSDLGELVLSNSATNEKGRVYLAQDLFSGKTNPDPSEKIRTKKIHLLEAYDQVMRGKITDSISVGGIARAHFFLYGEGCSTPKC